MDDRNHPLPEEAAPMDAGQAAPADDLSRYGEPEIDDAPAPRPAPGVDAAPEIDDDDDAPTEWVPSRFEKRIHAIPEGQWNLYQTLAGVAIGLFTAFSLFFGGPGLNPMFLVAVVLALAAPSVLEDRGRRRLTRFRITLIIVLAAGIIGMTVYTGVTKGWSTFTLRQEEEAALRALNRWRV